LSEPIWYDNEGGILTSSNTCKFFEKCLNTFFCLENVSLEVWEELITQSRCPLWRSLPAHSPYHKLDKLCVIPKIAQVAINNKQTLTAVILKSFSVLNDWGIYHKPLTQWTEKTWQNVQKHFSFLIMHCKFHN
jgi:hypothetical protein